MRNKVLLLFFSAVLVLMPFLPLTNAFASSTDLLSGKSISIGSTYNSVWTTTNNLTDNDSTSGVIIGANSASNDTIFYTFNSVQTLGSFKINGSNTSTQLSISFYGATNNLIATRTINFNENNTIVSYPVSNVYGVSVTNTSSTAFTIFDFSVYDNVAPVISHNSVTGLIESHKHNEATLSWSNPTSSHFTGTEIYKDGTLLATNTVDTNIYTATGLDPSTSYVFDVYALYDDSVKSTKVTQSVVTDSAPTDPTTIPPSNVTGLIVSDIKGDSASLTWSLPSDLDLDKVNIYLNNVLYESLPVSSISVLSNLNPDTNYSVSVSVTDVDGNESPKTNVTFTTIKAVDTTAPDSPKGLKVEQGSNALYASWDQNNEADINGYNVYVDGIKVNGSLIKNSFYAIGDLTNDTAYSVTVSAVDNSGNESVQSSLISQTPKGSKMPLLSIGYSLLDVATGVNGWFSSLWLVIAFAVAIPLSFYVASRLKLMFLE
jgi:hypothetical protein